MFRKRFRKGSLFLKHVALLVRTPPPFYRALRARNPASGRARGGGVLTRNTTVSDFAKIAPPAVAPNPSNALLFSYGLENIQKATGSLRFLLFRIGEFGETQKFSRKPSRPKAGFRDGENLRRFPILVHQAMPR